jgi:hypothetical protein
MDWRDLSGFEAAWAEMSGRGGWGVVRYVSFGPNRIGMSGKGRIGMSLVRAGGLRFVGAARAGPKWCGSGWSGMSARLGAV